MDDLKVITNRGELVRFSYSHVFEPDSMEGSEDKKYSVSILIPKTAKKTLADIKAKLQLAKEAGKASWGGKIPATFTHELLRDGDIERPDDPAYEGHYYLNAKSKMQPQVIDTEGIRLGPEEFYSGCYGCVSFTLYPYSKGSKGVAAGLGNILKVEDGEKLGGGASAAEDFGVEVDDLL